MTALLAKEIVTALAVAGLEGSVLAVIAFAICRGRVRPAWQAAIWLVVLARFVLPWTPELPWSLADLVASMRGGDAPIAIPLPGMPAPAPHASALWIALLATWLAPALALFARGVARSRRAYAVAGRALAAPDDARAELALLAARLDVRAPRLTVVTDVGVGPHVVGALRPIIVIPAALLGEPQLLRAALLHELAHVRRRDALARVVQLAATSLFFAWPIARLAARRLDLAREAACDAWALEAGDLPRPAYARLLVAMARLRLDGHAPAALAMAGHAHHLDARVAAVLAAPVRARLNLAHHLALAAFGLVALGGARTAHARITAVPCSYNTHTYTSDIAAALYAQHPEADLDGDGQLSRDEACELQAELREQADGPVSPAEPLYCNRDSEVGQNPPESSCHQGDGQ
nr:M56 family metallopeptidase [Kofleriaceae bacterium]